MEAKKYLYKEIQDFLVNVGWTHKIQICQSDIYIEKIRRLRVAKIVLTSLTSVGLGSFLMKIFPDFQFASTIIVFTLSLTMTIVVALDKESDYESLSLQNKQASNKYWELREKASECLFLLNSGKDTDNVNEVFLELKEIRKQANSELPYTSPAAVKLAGNKLKKNRDNDYSNDYEYFIPEKLRELGGEL